MGGRRSWPVLVVTTALVLAAVLVGDALTVSRRHSRSRPAAEGRPLTDPAGKAALEAVIVELEHFVESARGLRFLSAPKVSILDRDAFSAAYHRGDTPDPEGDRLYNGLLRALGLVEGSGTGGGNPEDEAESVAGFYDSDTKELVVRGVTPTPFVRQVLVHELTHALDDQHFGLDPQLPDDDAGFAFDALVEGDAVSIEDRYVDAMSPEDRKAAHDEEDRLFGANDKGDLLSELDDFPYVDGPRLVDAVLAAGGQARLDGAFRSPPSSTAEALHPERYLAGRTRQTVAAPPADGAVVDQGTLGELMLRLVLEETVSLREAERAAAGWAGDHYVAWRSGRRLCVRAAVVLDTPADATELAASLRVWAGDHRGATVTAGPEVGFSRCA